jgi:ABC-type transport system involved in multi-copper enzyme maturation permease subunit
MDDTPAPRKHPPRERTPLVGPLFAWDIIRLARRGQDARSRVILASVLFVTLVGFTTIWFRTTDLEALFFGKNQFADIKESARFAEQFMLAMLLAQMAVLVFLTPAYAAGSIADEKERRTWPFLMSTQLTNREIILGKFFGRLVFLGGILAAGLPVMSLTALVGGIDPYFLVFSYAFTGTTVMMLTALGIVSAVYASTFRGAMFRSYGMTVLYVGFGCGLHPILSPFAVLVMLYYMATDRLQFLGMGGAYMAVQLGITVFALNLALRRLRRVERRLPQRPLRAPKFRDRPVARPADQPPRGDRFGDDDREHRARHMDSYAEPRPRVFADDPFFWKERYTQGVRKTVDDESIQTLKVMGGILMACILGLVLFISILTSLQNSVGDTRSVSKVLLTFGLIGLQTYLLMLAPGVCGTVLREIQQKTLDSLLTIPIPRREILWPKWRIHFGRGAWAFAPGFLCVVIGLLTSPLPLLAIPGGLYFLGLWAFAVSFGLWLSCRVTTVVRGVMIHMSVTAVLALVPFIIVWQFSPAGASLAVMVAGACAAAVAGAAVVVWGLAVREFDRLGRA